MMTMPQNLLLDTNVWIENYIGERSDLTESRRLVDFCLDRQITLYVSIPSLKDIYYDISRYLKAKARSEGVEVTEAFAASAEQLAWGSVRNLMEQAIAVPVDLSDLWEARCFYELHHDFEDDLVLAAARRANVDFLVTSDKKLLTKAIVPTLSPADMLTLLKAFE